MYLNIDTAIHLMIHVALVKTQIRICQLSLLYVCVKDVLDTAGELPTNGERSDVAGRRGPIYRALGG